MVAWLGSVRLVSSIPRALVAAGLPSDVFAPTTIRIASVLKKKEKQEAWAHWWKTCLLITKSYKANLCQLTVTVFWSKRCFTCVGMPGVQHACPVWWTSVTLELELQGHHTTGARDSMSQELLGHLKPRCIESFGSIYISICPKVSQP